MSIIGILSSNLFSGGAAQNTLQTQGSQSRTPKFEQIKTEFEQLGQDLQSGNLKQAQTDYAALQANFPGASQISPAATGTAAAATTAATATPATTATTGNATVSQEFAQLGKDLQSGNLQAAQQDYTNIQQTAQQTAQQISQQNGTQQAGGHHHHHHHGGGTQSASSTTSNSQSNAINQAFGTLSQDLTAGNLSGAQAAFATLQNDLQQIGGFISSGSSPTSTASSSAIGGSLNVSA